MPAEQFVHCSSGLVADTFGLCDRGYLRNGYVADIVVFDPEEYAPEASYENPTEYSEGIEQLIISGTVVVDNGYTSQLPGQVLLREQCN
jgi:N-acyl-D-aspartate/D-glutamate deacylase